MKKKRSPVLLLLFLAFLPLLAAGCQKKENPLPAPPEEIAGALLSFEDFIGWSDEKLVAEKGEGEPQFFDLEGSDVLAARMYQETVFGAAGTVSFLFGDDRAVNAVAVAVPGVAAAAFLAELEEALGSPDLAVREGGAFHMEWQREGRLYCLEDDGIAVTLTVS